MKLRICETVTIDPERVKALVRIAESCGHGYDGCKAPGKLIRRLLVSRINAEVTYCLEKVSRDYYEDDDDQD